VGRVGWVGVTTTTNRNEESLTGAGLEQFSPLMGSARWKLDRVQFVLKLMFNFLWPAAKLQTDIRTVALGDFIRDKRQLDL